MKYILDIPNIDNCEIVSMHNMFQIVIRPTQWKKGIYFLLRKGKVIYVGKSQTVQNRISTHWLNYKFDSFLYMEIDEPFRRTMIEAYFIEKYKPILNRTV